MIIGAIIPKLAGIERRNAIADVLAAARAIGHSRWRALTLVRIAECPSEEEKPALVSDAFTDKCESRGAVADVVGIEGGVVSGLFNEP